MWTWGGREGLLVGRRETFETLWDSRGLWQVSPDFVITTLLTHWGRDKIAAIFQKTSSKTFSLNENARISIKILLKFVPKGPINKIPALVQIIAWRRSGDKPLSEPMMVSSLTHICVTRPQWVNSLAPGRFDWNPRLLFYVIFKLILVFDGWDISVILPPAECHWILLMKSQH